MIVSHKHRYIFIRTEKTAGTSIEIALSKYCGPDDIITRMRHKDEITRQMLGYRGPQNYIIPFSKYSLRDLLTSIYDRRRIVFYHHASAEFIKKYVDKDVWNSYFKFCFERNPWDKVISWYYWRYRNDPRPSLSAFVQSQEANIIKGFDLYTISSELVVDKVFLFEQLDEAMKEIYNRVCLPEIPSPPRTKSEYRTDKRSYRDILSEEDKEKIAKVYAREIKHFNYRF